MSIDGRLEKFERSLNYRELAFLWLKTMQAKGGFSDYWKFGSFESWPSESEELGFLYNLVFEVNSAVMLASCRLRDLASWASLLGLVILTFPTAAEPSLTPEFVCAWRQKIRTLLEGVAALQQAVEVISAQYFDGHQVLFVDAREELISSYERARLLANGYNLFADEKGVERIDMQSLESRQGPRRGQLLNQWTMLARSKALAAMGRDFEASDEVLAWLRSNATAAS